MSVEATDVKKLREMTDAGFMACKTALEESGGDFEAAKDLLRTQGEMSVQKRSGKDAGEGAVFSYIHGKGRVGVLLDLNCETDFAADTDAFRELGKTLCLQIAAMSPRWVSQEDAPLDAVSRERGILLEQAKDEGKPDNIAEKMVEGRLRKFYETFCLMDQECVSQEKTKVSDVVTEAAGRIKEKVVVKRFVRFALGEE